MKTVLLVAESVTLVCNWLVAFWNRLCSPLTSNFRLLTRLSMAAVSFAAFEPSPVDRGDPLLLLEPPGPPSCESVAECMVSVMLAKCES